MNELASQIHPVVEDNIVISGPNIGRLKNTDIAHETALIEDHVRTERPESVTWLGHEERMDNVIKDKMAKAAIKATLENDINNMALAGLRGKELANETIDAKPLVDETAKVGSDFDKVREQSLKVGARA